MKRKNQIILTLFGMMVVVLALLVIINTDNIRSLVVRGIGLYGSLAVFFFSFLADIFMQPFGPETPGLFAIILGLEFYQVYIATIIGSTFGGLFSFLLGRHFLLNRVGNICQVKKYRNYCKSFSKYGRISLAVAAITPIPYVLFCWLSGAFHMRIRDFIIFGAIPRIFRIGFYLGLAWIVLA